MVELDPEVIEVARKSREVHRGVFDDPRLKVTVGDGLAYLRETAVRYDLVVLDLTDPVGPSMELYSPATFARARRAWRRAARSRCTSARPSRIRSACARRSANLRQVFARRDAVLRLHPDLRRSGASPAPPTRSTRARCRRPRSSGGSRARRGRPAVLQRRDAPRVVRAAELRPRARSRDVVRAPRAASAGADAPDRSFNAARRPCRIASRCRPPPACAGQPAPASARCAHAGTTGT